MPLGFYNRTPANRTASAMRYRANYRMTDSLSIQLDLGVQYACRYEYTAELEARLPLWWGYDEFYQMSANFELLADARAYIKQAYQMYGELALELNPVLSASYYVSAELEVSASMYLVISPLWDTMFSNLLIDIDSVQTRETVMSFDSLVMPAGSVLVIDSENYTITLNGVNIIDLYQGDWFSFTHKLLGLAAESGTSGKPTVSVLYRECFL